MYDIILQAPLFPIEEEWSWLTDLAVSYNGTEGDRIPLLRYPHRSFSGSFQFDDKEELQRHLAMMTKKFRTEFKFPLFQYQTKLKAGVDAGMTTVTVNARRGDFRLDSPAVIMEGPVYEEVEISAATDTTLDFTDPLVNAYSKKAIVCPLSTVFAEPGTSVSRLNPDQAATSRFSLNERICPIPFLAPLNDAVVTTFDSLPVLSYVPMGSTFESKIATGLIPVDYPGLQDIVTPWTYSQWAYSYTFNANRFGGVNDLEWWQAFAETIQGASNLFLFPTNRSDMEIITPASPSGTTIVVKGEEYSQHYQAHGSFTRIFIDSDAGRHYAKITSVALVLGNDRLTFSPALPAGAEWASNQSIGFLLKVRAENDKILLTHYGLQSDVKIDLRTVV